MTNWNLHWLDASGDLSDLKNRLERDVRLSREALSPFVQPMPLDILVERGSEGNIPEIGMSVQVSRATLMTVRIDPDNPDFLDYQASGGFQRQIVRGAHQAMRSASAGYGFTLGGALVSEGLAGQFVRLVFANDPELWETAVPPQELNSLWPQHRDLMTPKYDHANWFEGAGALPRWLGYTMGFKLVENWLVSGAEITPQRMIDIPAPKVLTVALVRSMVS